MGIQEKIKEIEDEMFKTQKNKATERHLGILRAKLAQLRAKLISGSGGGGGGSGGFDVKKTGDASVALIGFPSVGKSTILTKITNAESQVAAYAFTTLTCIPGMMEYNGAKIQILDLPGIVEGAKDGRGRGREVIAVARSTDLIVAILDAAHPEQQASIERELEGFGIRINKKPPNIFVSKTDKNGIIIDSTLPLTKISKDEIVSVLNTYDYFNADVIFRDDGGVDELIDVLEGNRVYIPAIYVINKTDTVDAKQLEKFPKESIPVIANIGKNLDAVKDMIYEKLKLIRVYTKRKGEELDDEPMVVRAGTNVAEICNLLHRDLRKNFRYGLVWGKSAKHPGQRVGLNHVLLDEDIVQVIKR
ncbi:MAG: GTP-binding protein [Candidatus Micrarchaeota archaeon]